VSEAVLPLTTIGHVTPRVDAMARVTGQAKYTNDIKLPGMLYARVLRSPHPHARILCIDTSEASRLPGVKAVITHETAHVVWGAGAVAGGESREMLGIMPPPASHPPQGPCPDTSA
jgi:CO/xanthine dehydrogenase Mo-binding subunit